MILTKMHNVSRILVPILLLSGMIWGLFGVPADSLQGTISRLIYLHVPAAWCALGGYTSLGVLSLGCLVWRSPILGITTQMIARVTQIFILITLISGMIWGKYSWGTWWVWDARLTSVFILLMMNTGVLYLMGAPGVPVERLQAAHIMAIIGLINLPIIRFSVEWWQTLHQPSSFSVTQYPTVDVQMIIPLMLVFFGFVGYGVSMVSLSVRSAILQVRIRTMRRAL